MSTTERSDQINADDYKVSYDEDYNDGNKLRKRMDEQFKDVNKKTNDIFKVLKYSLIVLLCLLVVIVCLGAVTLADTQKKTSKDYPPIREKECDKGWFDGSSVGLGCLLFSFPPEIELLLPMTEAQALKFCKSKDKGSRLIELENKTQLDFLSSNSDKMPMFLKPYSSENLPIYTFLSGAHFNGTMADDGKSGLWLWESGREVQDWVWGGEVILPFKKHYLAFQHKNTRKSFIGKKYPLTGTPRTKIVPLCQKK